METFPRSGGYILGFRLDPAEKLDALLEETSKFLQLFTMSPIFGVDFTIEAASTDTPEIIAPKVEEDVDIVEDEADNHVAAYYLDNGTDGDLDENGAMNLGYDTRLGLATENMSKEMSLESLWRVI